MPLKSILLTIAAGIAGTAGSEADTKWPPPLGRFSFAHPTVKATAVVV
jgi:hypothetical protein